MKLIPAKCPSCGANIKINGSDTKTKCEYCKTTILIDDSKNKLKLFLEDNLQEKLEKVHKYIKLKEYGSASDLVDKMIAKDSLNIDAYYERIRINLALLKESGFDGSHDRECDTTNWGYVDNIFKSFDRIKKIDDEERLNSSLKKIQGDIERLKEYEKKLNDDKKQYKDSIKRINDLISKKSKYNHSFDKDINRIFSKTFELEKELSSSIKLKSVLAIYSNGDILIENLVGKYSCSSTNKNLNIDIVNSYIDTFDKEINKIYGKVDKNNTFLNIVYIFSLLINLVFFIVPLIITIHLIFSNGGLASGICMILFIDSWLLPLTSGLIVNSLNSIKSNSNK